MLLTEVEWNWPQPWCLDAKVTFEWTNDSNTSAVQSQMECTWGSAHSYSLALEVVEVKVDVYGEEIKHNGNNVFVRPLC